MISPISSVSLQNDRITPIKAAGKVINTGKELEQHKQQEYTRINTHEQAHKSAGGSQAGGITILSDSNGIPFSGFVPIQMPSEVNKANPQETYRMAEVAFRAATAPADDLSDADKAIASRASSLMSMAQTDMNNPCCQGKNKNTGNKLNIIA